MSQYLPDFDPQAGPPSPDSGVWTGLAGAVTMAKIASALRVPRTTTPADRIKSVPSPWARALLFEHALFNPQHPSHEEITGEWRGLLGLLALGERIGIPLSFRPVRLDGSNRVLDALGRMLPPDEVARWSPVVLLQLNGTPIGATSPRTLVFTGMRRTELSNVPFQQDNRLIDPVPYYRSLNDTETLAHLRAWLENAIAGLRGQALSAFVDDANTAGNRSNQLLKALGAWRDEFQVPATPSASYSVTSSLADALPNGHPAAAAFRYMLSLQADTGSAGDSAGDLELAHRDGKPLLVLPGSRGRIEKGGHPYSGPVRVPGGQGRQADEGVLTTPIEAGRLNVDVLDASTLFCNHLIEVSDVNSEHAFTLELKGRHVLLPFKPQIADLLSPDEIIGRVEVKGELSSDVEVLLRLPIQHGREVVFSRSYRDAQILHEEVTGDLAVWPNFVTTPRDAWQHYFYMHQQGPTARLRFEPLASKTDAYSDGQRWWGATSAPPIVWRGFVKDHGAEGLLLLRGMTEVAVTQPAWDVSVDFGSTHTRAYRLYKNAQAVSTPQPVAMQPRTLQLFGNTGKDSFFHKDKQDVHSLEELLTSVLLPARGQRREAPKQWLPVDGVLAWDMQQAVQLDDNQVRTRLKWHGDDADKEAFRSYLQQLYLMIAAEAAAAGSRVSSIVSAYPSVFPESLRWEHETEWEKLNGFFGVEVKKSASESSALMRYLNREEGVAASTNLLACDIGGSTSDLAVWADSELRYGDSVRFAGDLIGRVMVTSAEARNAVEQAARKAPLEFGSAIFTNRSERADQAFNTLLRAVARKRNGSIEDLGRLLAAEGEAGKLVIAHAGFLFAVLSFLLGQIARRQGLQHDRVQLRFGGRGAGFWNWLDRLSPQGKEEICASFLRAGLGADVEVSTDVSKKLKEEVGQGLLHRLDKELPAPFNRETYFGENGFAAAGGDGFAWTDTLNSKNLVQIAPPQPLNVGRLDQLGAFVRAFDQTTGGREMAHALGIKPDVLESRAFRDQLHEHLFGPTSAYATARRRDASQSDMSMLEPLFVEEARTLLEFTTGNGHLFDHVRQ